MCGIFIKFATGNPCDMNLKRKIYLLICRLFYREFRNGEYVNGNLIKFIFWQKICRINSYTPWPVHFTSKIISPSNIHGSRAEGFRPIGMAVGNYIDARCGIIIEENVHVGPRVSIISKNHNLTDYDNFDESAPVTLHRDCWIATGAIILAGVELGEHTVVGAGSVVTHSFTEGNVLIAGNPARVIKHLPPYTHR